MALSNQQRAYLQRMRSNFQNLAEAFANLDDLRDIYFDRGYNTLVDGDLTGEEVASDITVADLASAINFIEAMGLLLNNGVPTQADWDATMSKMRFL